MAQKNTVQTLSWDLLLLYIGAFFYPDLCPPLGFF